MLVSDAYGGNGGIARYNRNLAEALAEIDAIKKVVMLPRLGGSDGSFCQGKIFQEGSARQSNFDYLYMLARLLSAPTDLVFCGHLNLLPIAVFCAMRKRCPVILQVHGIEAWQRPGWFRRLFLKRAQAIWSVSRVTRDRMNEWANLPDERYTIIPNVVRLRDYSLAAPSLEFLEKWGLRGKKILLTLGRLDPRERYKGIDEILACLPRLLVQEPNLVYVIAGEGADRGRLQARANELGVEDRVLFIGFVEEEEKKRLLQSADVFAMPGSGEGFGIVYLEAMACGVPTIGSTRDGSSEALRGGDLGQVVDPADSEALLQSIRRALKEKRAIPRGIEFFDWPQHVLRIRAALQSLRCGARPSRGYLQR